MNRCQIITGDCRQALKELPSGSVHCCVTSPPYLHLRRIVVYSHRGKRYANQKGSAFKSTHRVQKGSALEDSQTLVVKRLAFQRIYHQPTLRVRHCQRRSSDRKRNLFLVGKARHTEAQDVGNSCYKILGIDWHQKRSVREAWNFESELEGWSYTIAPEILLSVGMETTCQRCPCARQVLPFVSFKRKIGNPPHRPIQPISTSHAGHRKCNFTLSLLPRSDTEQGK